MLCLMHIALWKVPSKIHQMFIAPRPVHVRRLEGMILGRGIFWGRFFLWGSGFLGSGVFGGWGWWCAVCKVLAGARLWHRETVAQLVPMVRPANPCSVGSGEKSS